ncbi:RNA 2',3'-cyclic phosphodiesterase [Pseudoprimorskyibacter insulae]|uniref:RNA 2',3'-cyclic phosphodiesterase n=1 Tax=Pseudoprimorskyibacter insulae TaxID=1695997 RepID=A0A2R8APY5_9RHOB|nr:RNA 2',3'-cyclic phosphodiesterase [Pseudoprimorskyibacter insulae]SPF77957.1 RNA 2',3'-cyclic phosphodiesterase [Pseudoprimorskyibacter insulae]
MIRSFIALALPTPIREQAKALQTKAAGLGIRCVPPENLHLTLAFLGDQPQTALEDLHPGLDAISLPPVPLQSAGVVPFSAKHQTAIALTIKDTPELSALHKAVARAVRHSGIRLERRKFRPHVTIARMASSQMASSAAQTLLAGTPPQPIAPERTDSFALYESELTPQGARYTPLADYSLR